TPGERPALLALAEPATAIVEARMSAAQSQSAYRREERSTKLASMGHHLHTKENSAADTRRGCGHLPTRAGASQQRAQAVARSVAPLVLKEASAYRLSIAPALHRVVKRTRTFVLTTIVVALALPAAAQTQRAATPLAI